MGDLKNVQKIFIFEKDQRSAIREANNTIGNLMCSNTFSGGYLTSDIEYINAIVINNVRQ